MNKEYRILERKRLRPGEEARVYELDNPYEFKVQSQLLTNNWEDE